MIKNSFLIILLLLLIVASAQQATKAKSHKTHELLSSSEIVFSHVVHDFGDVPRRQKLIHTFPFSIKGQDSLKIDRSLSPCGCAIIQISNKNLGPGDTGSVIVEFTSTMVEGVFEREFSIITNSKTKKSNGLKIKGNNQRLMWFKPPVIDLEQFQVGSNDTFLLTIFWKRWEKPGFKQAEGIPFFNYGNILNKNDDTTIWELPIILSSDAQTKYYSDTLIINTSSDSWPKIKVPVQGRIRGPVTIKPDYINMGNIKTGEQVSCSILLISSATVDSILSCETSENNVTIGEIRPLNKNKIRIYIKSVKSPKNKKINCEVIVKVLCKEKKEEARAAVVGRYVK